MKRIFWGLIFCFSIIWICTASIAADDGKTGKNVPNAVWENIAHEFSTVLEGKIVTHTFKVRNEGDGVLVIQRVRTS